MDDRTGNQWTNSSGEMRYGRVEASECAARFWIGRSQPHGLGNVVLSLVLGECGKLRQFPIDPLVRGVAKVGCHASHDSHTSHDSPGQHAFQHSGSRFRQQRPTSRSDPLKTQAIEKRSGRKCETGPGSSKELPVPLQESPPGFSFTAFAVRFKVVGPRVDCECWVASQRVECQTLTRRSQTRIL